MRSERGNILFLILLAIILFAALTYAVNGGFRVTQDQNIPKEKANAIAAEIVQKTVLVEQAVNRLRVVGGCKDTEIQFSIPAVPYDTPSPADKHCYVFDKAGAGLTNPTFSPEYYDSVHSAGTRWGNYVVTSNKVNNLGTDCDSPYDSCGDLMMIIPFLKKDVCTAINKAYGVNGIPQIAGNLQANKFNDYQNTEGSTANTGKVIGGTDLTGRHAMCFEGKNAVYGISGTNPVTGTGYNSSSGATGVYFYYHTLIAR